MLIGGTKIRTNTIQIGELSIGTVIEKAQQPLQPRVGVSVDVFRHLVVHKGIILMADDAAGVGDLGDVASTVTFVGTASVPNLIVESGSEVLLCCPFRPTRSTY